jgi:hypothetical protein
MAEDDFELADAYYPQLLRVARSAGLDLSEDRAKDDLVARLNDAGVERVGHDDWELDGEPLELKEPQTNNSGGPSDKTILYCLTRERTEEFIDDIREAVESQTDLVVRESGEDGDKYALVFPAAAQVEDAGKQSDDGDDKLAEMTRDELYEMAQERDLDGRSDMSKTELVEALSA